MTNENRQYLIGCRFGPRFPPAVDEELDRFFARQRGAHEIRRTSVGRRVVQMTEEQCQNLAQECKEAVIDEDAPLQLFGMPGLSDFRAAGGRTYTLKVSVRDQTDSRPLSDVTIFGVGPSGLTYESVTDQEGQAVLQTSESPLEHVIASPPAEHWSRFVAQVDLSSPKTLELKLKRLFAAGAYDWGHRLMGFRAVNDRFSGDGIKVGVIDSGVSPRNGDLAPEQGVATVDGQDGQSWDQDEKGHGTHVCGIIGARNWGLGIVGGAPKARLYPVKVFPDGRLSSLVEGIEWCIRNRMDVINIGAGSRQRSQVVAGVVRDAYDHGIVCVAPAGNESSTLAYPAALPTTIAVGAIGRFGAFPEDSAHTLRIGAALDWYGGLFAANFSNTGERIDVCAPGVAILSTVPNGYASWDGTSMACSMVSALVALILEAYPAVRTGDAQQVEYVRQILHGSAVDLGMPADIQGRGLPMAPNALPPAG